MAVDPTKAYGQTQKSVIGGRAGEAEAFAKSASNLHAASQEPIDAAAYEEALHTNQKLWTVLQASLLEDEGRLPDDLRQDIIKLSIFVDSQTLKALAHPSAANVETIININRNMANGLFKRPKD